MKTWVKHFSNTVARDGELKWCEEVGDEPVSLRTLIISLLNFSASYLVFFVLWLIEHTLHGDFDEDHYDLRHFNWVTTTSSFRSGHVPEMGWVKKSLTYDGESVYSARFGVACGQTSPPEEKGDKRFLALARLSHPLKTIIREAEELMRSGLPTEVREIHITPMQLTALKRRRELPDFERWCNLAGFTLELISKDPRSMYLALKLNQHEELEVHDESDALPTQERRRGRPHLRRVA